MKTENEKPKFSTSNVPRRNHNPFRFQVHVGIDGELGAKAHEYCQKHNISNIAFVVAAIKFALENQ